MAEGISTRPVLTVVALGDSLILAHRHAMGEGLTDMLEWELAGRLGDAADVIVVNSGVGSDTAEGGLARFDRDVAAHQPDAVIVHFCGNDMGKGTPDWFAENLDALVSRIRVKTGAAVLLLSGVYVNETQHAWSRDGKFAEFGGMNACMREKMMPRIDEIAERHGAPVLSAYGVIADAVGEHDEKSETYLQPSDGVHLMAEGNRLLAAAVAELAEPVLREIAKNKAGRLPAALPEPLLLPEPKRLTFDGGTVAKLDAVALVGSAPTAEKPLALFSEVLAKADIGLVEESDASAYRLIVKQADAAGFLPDVADEAAYSEAYRLRFSPGEAELEAAADAGFRHGLATLTQLIKRLGIRGELPAVTIVDWPSMAYRGVFMEDKFGTDLSTLDDWKEVVDYLAARKMNVMGVGLYGCWGVQYDGHGTEWLMAPVPGHPELKTEWICRWYSAAVGEWKEIRYLPRMFEGDFFGDLVAYGRDRGVRVIPFVNSLGHNTLIPRSIPEVSAKDAQGGATGYGYCLSSPKTWEFLESWYGAIVDKYLLPNGADAFHIQMDEVYPAIGRNPSDPKQVVSPECRCPACARRPYEDRIVDYLVRLIKFLVSRGMKHVIMWNDQLTRHMDLVQPFVERLKAEDVFENVILHWWWYNNENIHEKCHPAVGRGLRGWVGPMTCYFNWSCYDQRHQNIANMLAMGHAEAAEGAVSYSVYDPASDFDFALMADYAWDARGAGPIRSALHKFASAAAGPCAAQLAEAIRLLDLASDSPLRRDMVYYTYSYPAADQPYPRQYPLEPLEKLKAMEEAGKDPRSMLRQVFSWSRRAKRLLQQIPAEHESETSRNLVAAAARSEALAGAFIGLMRIWRQAPAAEAGNEILAAAALGNVRFLVEWFPARMAEVEANKPEYLAPSFMRDLSVMYEFLLQLRDDVQEAADGKRPWAEVRWFVENCVAQRGM